jgi:DNA (cytosine-5)-methyltransferase 1
MVEIAAVPFNGYRVASTFSGCGGSSLGYRMAGFKVVWANEFITPASDVYRANFPDTPLDLRDIRLVEAGEILAATGLGVGELDLLDGSPPCASFSMAGKRHKGWGEVKNYSAGRKQRTEDLFFEYARLVKALQPRVFVAENVSGLVKGAGKGYFLDILAALKACGYRVRAQLLDAQWLGVPQARQRLILIGTRLDLAIDPAFPTPRSYRYSVRDALPWIGAIECANGFNGHAMAPASSPAATVQASRAVRVEVSSNLEFKQIWKDAAAAPSPTITTDHDRRNGGLVRVTTYGGKARSINEPAPTVLTHGRRRTRSEMTLAVEPEADMARFAVGRELDKLGQGETSDRYFQLVRASLAAPSPTITAEGRKAHAASVAHPTECRKFSIAELRRICAFPDDFVLLGTYAEQWERLGRAVPPVMMAAIAETIRDRVLDPVTRRKGADRSAPLQAVAA